MEPCDQDIDDKLIGVGRGRKIEVFVPGRRVKRPNDGCFHERPPYETQMSV
jgi:hypothetical protein